MNDQLEAHVSKTAYETISAWRKEPKYAQYADEVEALIQQERWQDLEDRFFQKIAFGTGGIRGETGVGSNRINRVTIGEAAQGLSRYVLDSIDDAADRGIVIAYDTRRTSEEFCRYVASVVAAHGITTYIFDSFRSTPELSFAVRHLGAAAGVVISASHNPAADNGFKAYWSDGGQLVAPHDAAVVQYAAQVAEIMTVDIDEALKDGRIVVLDESIDAAYVRAVTENTLGDQRDLSIVYSPLHGAGQTSVLPVLRAAGFTSVSVVATQMIPDGNFPDIEGGKPNPEEKVANKQAVEQMLRVGADIAITNDPDADRVGVMVNQRGSVAYLTGNQSAVLAAEWLLSQKRARGDLRSTDYLAKTIVTTDLLDALAREYAVGLYGSMLVGFKYIGRLMTSLDETEQRIVLGGEESYGVLIGDYARDKDGAAGALPLAEYAATLKQQGKTLYDRLLELFERHGVYAETLHSVYFPGASGFAKMQDVMEQLRTHPPLEVDGSSVTAVLDYRQLVRRDVATGEESVIECDAGNVVVLEFDGDNRRRIAIRPSGTEPKMKLYVQWYEAFSGGDVQEQYEVVLARLARISSDLEQKVL